MLILHSGRVIFSQARDRSGRDHLSESHLAVPRSAKPRAEPNELVPLLVAHLLTQPGMLRVKGCKRPGCPNFIVLATGKGHPKWFCLPNVYGSSRAFTSYLFIRAECVSDSPCGRRVFSMLLRIAGDNRYSWVLKFRTEVNGGYERRTAFIRGTQ